MSRSDRRTWRAARTLPDVAGRVALWLTGGIDSLPGYQPRYGPDRETAGIIPALVALNMAGYVTTCSQPGLDGDLRQRAAVEGLIEDPATLATITARAERAGLIVATGAARIAVTRWNDRPITWFGGMDDHDDDAQWGVLHPDARAAMGAAVHIAIVAPEYGPAGDRLWAALTTDTDTHNEENRMSTNDPIEYANAPSTVSEVGGVIALASGLIGWEPSAAEYHELALRKAALLDRIAVANPSPDEERAADDAATELVSLVESETRPNDDGDPVAGDGWTLPEDGQHPREYVRIEYARWSTDAAELPASDPTAPATVTVTAPDVRPHALTIARRVDDAEYEMTHLGGVIVCTDADRAIDVEYALREEGHVPTRHTGERRVYLDL